MAGLSPRARGINEPASAATRMPLFSKFVEWPPAGSLQGEGRSKVWEGRITIQAFGEFHVRVHGTAEGPWPKQTETTRKLIANAIALRAAAAPPILEGMAEAGILPEGLVLDATSLWQHLKPCFAEVSQPDPGLMGSVAISLGFEMPWWEAQLLQIRTIDGEFTEAYPE